MTTLFEPYKIDPMSIRNRFVRSATTSYWSDEGGVIRPEIVELYHNLAKGELGLIVKGHLYVADVGKAHVGMAGISREEHIPKLMELTEAVHRNGGKNSCTAQPCRGTQHNRQSRAFRVLWGGLESQGHDVG